MLSWFESVGSAAVRVADRRRRMDSGFMVIDCQRGFWEMVDFRRCSKKEHQYLYLLSFVVWSELTAPGLIKCDQ